MDSGVGRLSKYLVNIFMKRNFIRFKKEIPIYESPLGHLSILSKLQGFIATCYPEHRVILVFFKWRPFYKSPGGLAVIFHWLSSAVGCSLLFLACASVNGSFMDGYSAKNLSWRCLLKMDKVRGWWCFSLRFCRCSSLASPTMVS